MTANTPRKGLKARLEVARAERVVDLPVPGLDGVHVRYRTLTAVELERIGEAARGGRNGAKRKDKDTAPLLTASLDTLVEACLGVWEEVDGKGTSVVESPEFDGIVDLDTRTLTGNLPTFSDPELAEELGVDGRAGAVVLALYVTEGDVIGTADAVVVHSGTNGDELLAEARTF